MSQPPLAKPVDERPAGRWNVIAKKNRHNQTGFLIVDADDDNKPIAAVMPESKNDKKHPITRRRRAWAIALELHAMDIDMEKQLDASDPTNPPIPDNIIRGAE